MAPRIKPSLKNYARNTCGNRSKLDVLHSILTDPIKKKARRKPKLEIKELPPRSQQIGLDPVNSSDSFLAVDKVIKNDNTFDRLLNKTNYNKVTFKLVVQNNSSDSSLSMIQKSNKQRSPLELQITKKCSPRKRIRSVKKRSPIVTRSVSFQNSLSDSNKVEGDKRVRTLDKTVDESLYIEKENAIKDYNTKENSLATSFDPIFSKTFTEKYNNLNVSVIETSAISSTPVMPVFKERLINETILSPIVNLQPNMTPKLKQVSKVRKSKLICDKENRGDKGDESLHSEIATANLERQIMSKNEVKLLRSAIVNVTLLNSTRLEAPFMNLTSINFDSINETNLRDAITELNHSKIAVVNITSMNFDKYLNKSNYDLDRLLSPIVNITRIDLNDFLKHRSICNESISDRSIEDEGGTELCVSESSLDNKIKLNNSSESDFKGFPPCNSLSQVKDEISTELERPHLNSSEDEDNQQIYLTLRRRRVPRSKGVSRSSNRSKQSSNSTCDSINQTNLSAKSAIGEDLLNDKENISPKSYITLRTRRIHKSSIKSKSRIIHTQFDSLYISDKDSVSQINTNLKCNTVSPDLFESYNSSLYPKTPSKYTSAVIDLNSNTRLSAENSKRLRNSRFKQSVNSYKLGAVYYGDNTPIKITKRTRMYTPKKNYKIVDSMRKTSTPIFITPLKDSTNITVDSVSASITNGTDFSVNTPIKLGLKGDYKIADLLRETSTPKVPNNLPLNATSLKDTSNIIDDKTADSISASMTNAAALKQNYSIVDLVDGATTAEFISMEPNETSSKLQEACDSLPVNDNESKKEVAFAVPKLPIPKKRQDPIQDEKIVLKPGKLWRRSLLEVRNSKSGVSPLRQSLICVADKGCNVCSCVQCKQNVVNELCSKRLSVRVVPLTHIKNDIVRKQSTALEDYALSSTNNYLQLQSSLNDSHQNSTLSKDDSIVFIEQETQIVQSGTITAREIVLSKCRQDAPISFTKLYPNSMLQNCQKIGEGVYGEVFLVRRPASKDTSVMKIIPIEGSLLVNGERQKTFQEILSEITIAMELSKLRTNTRNRTDCFNELKKVACVQGKYPKRLVELWELYDENRGSENDHPKIFNKDQLYIVLELANGGNDMENFVFENSQQAYSIIMQITLALAVAESEIEFEHRDLHWGNVLISSTDKANIIFSLNGKNISLKSYGVHVAIIDYTLSRMSHDNVCLYNDLAMDPDLFTATGDYQFEVYRLMQNQNSNDWQHFEPYTNVLWLHYLLDKCISSLRYRKKTTKLHKQYLGNLKKLYKDALDYNSAKMFAADKFVD